MVARKGKQNNPRSVNPAAQRWSIRFSSARAKREWDDATLAEPEIMRDEKERLHTKPLDRSENPRRTHPLKGSRTFVAPSNDEKLPLWQREPTSAGRIWYAPDKKAHVLWITKVTLSHPKENE